MILHTVNKPPSHAALSDCLAVMAIDEVMLPVCYTHLTLPTTHYV